MGSPKILITDYHCASNRGDAAILEGVIAGLQAHYPEASFTVATEFPTAAEAIHGVNVIEQRTVPFKPYHFQKNSELALFTLNAFAKRTISQIPTSGRLASSLNLEPYLEADIVVATGGQYLTDNYMPSKIGALWELYVCKLLETPVVLYAQSIGPLKTEPYVSIARCVLDCVDFITVRDHQSKDILKSVGVSKTPIVVTADAAFSMPLEESVKKPIQQRRIEHVPALESSNPVVSISCREWSHYGSGGQDQYERAVAEFTDWLLEEHSVDVVFLSTCTGFDGYHTDDRTTAHSIIGRISQGTSSNPKIMTGEYTPQELSRLYEDVDLHIGTRMHSNILALLQTTPIVGIEYEFKTSELLRQFELEEYVVDIDQITSEELIQTVDNAFERLESIRDRIDTNLETVQSESMRNAELVAEHIDL